MAGFISEMDFKCGRDKPILLFKKICCFQTRTAAYIVAAIELILTSLFMGLAMYQAAQDQWLLYGHSFSNYTTFRKEFYAMPESERPDPDYSAIILPTILRSIPFIVHVIFTAILIHGLRKNKFGWMRIWLWVRFANMIDNVVEAFAFGSLYLSDLLPVSIWALLSCIAIIIVRSHVIHGARRGGFLTLQEEPKNEEI